MMAINEISKKITDHQAKKRKKIHIKENDKKKRFRTNVPSAQELEDLREAETSFHSNLFKMEVEELLKESKPQVPCEKINCFLEKLENFLLNVSEKPQNSIDDFPVDIPVPFMKKVPTDKGVFKFCPPTKFLKIGSFTLETSYSSEPIIDAAIEIPKVCFQSIDFVNERYHRKRALYMACIAEYLREADFVQDLKFTYRNDCHLKPVLLITSKEIDNLTVCLTAYPPENTFKLTRYIPTKNNVRSSWILKRTEDDLTIPTPYYNSTVLEDLLLYKLHSFLQETLVLQSIKDGIILVKIWCQQRGLLSGYGRLNGFIIAMFIAYLFKKQKINSFMSSYQIFRCTLLAFQHETFEKGISLADEDDKQPSMEDFQKVFASIFVDNSGFLNLLYSVSKETIHRLKHEAKLGLKILDSELPTCFSLLFMNQIPAFEKFEYLVHFKGPKKFRKYAKLLCKEEDTVNFGENKIASVVPKICDILQKGLHDRVLMLDFIKDKVMPWCISDPPPSPNCGQVTIGLLLNPEVSINNLEKGPLADDPQAKVFREFWSDQSELRRFQDGSIREAVFWPATTIEDKRKVFSQMIKDILRRHLSAEEKDITVRGTEVDCVLHVPKQILSSDIPAYGTGEEAHIKLMQSFNSLSKQLRSLEGLPLMLSSIHGISPAFHFSEVFPPLSVSPVDKSMCFESYCKLKIKDKPSKVPTFTPALKVVVGFEGSGKWPDDIEAIKRVKAAFYIKIAELMRTKYSLVSTPFLTHTDVVKDGFVFRLIIACHKELFLMKQHKMPSGVTKIMETEESREFELTTEILPKLNSILHGLHQQHNTFGAACRLAKRWISSQFKHNYIHDIIIELLVAHCCYHPEPYTVPSSPQTAFLRFLSLFVNHDWKTSPLVVNLNNELQRNEIEEIFSAFTAQRSTLPPMVVCTPLDKRGNLFTKKRPLALILKRIGIFAKSALNMLNENLYSMKDFDIKAIYRPNLESYDVIIHLNHCAIPKLSCAVDISTTDELIPLEPYNELVNKVYPVVEFDPASKYLEELKANFDDFAFFFYDIYGGDIIAVVWKKSAFAPRDFKVSNANCSLSKKGSIVANVASILEDFKLLGNGIVNHITVQKEL